MYSHDLYAHLGDAILEAIKSNSATRIIDVKDFLSNDPDLDDIMIIMMSNLMGIPELLEHKIKLFKPSELGLISSLGDELRILPKGETDEYGRTLGLSNNRYRGAKIGQLVYRRDKVSKDIIPCTDWVRGSGQYEQVILSLHPDNYVGRIQVPKPKQGTLF